MLAVLPWQQLSSIPGIGVVRLLQPDAMATQVAQYIVNPKNYKQHFACYSGGNGAQYAYDQGRKKSTDRPKPKSRNAAADKNHQHAELQDDMNCGHKPRRNQAVKNKDFAHG